MTLSVRIEPLAAAHDRAAFECGVSTLDRYLRERASQEIRRRVANCFVALDTDAGLIAGYYTLAATSIPVTQLPESLTRRLPRYPVIPATLIGRLAVDGRYRGQHLGAALIANAMRRSTQGDAAAFAVVVDAKDETAEAFYRHLGFEPLVSRPGSLFLPVKSG